MYLYSIISVNELNDDTIQQGTPTPASAPVQEEPRSIAVVAFYLFLGAAGGWFLINKFIKPSRKSDTEQSSNNSQPVSTLGKLLLHSSGTALSLCLWLFALQLLAPTRIMILEYVEYVIAVVVGGLLKWNRGSKTLQIQNVGLLHWIIVFVYS
ncbi:dipeptidyl-aminopeptidase [Acrasis kona]|uniref:Dipeptidyl-aminopeptidase n=1 Tax=Acrasis kona TaxID=1008807 RepID=A0AAW2ZM82_9EUKA